MPYASPELREAREALAESESRFRAVTALSSDWYWEQDERQRYTLLSDDIEDRTGVSARATLGRTCWESGARCDRAERAALEALIDARKPFYDFQFERDGHDGSTRRLSISGEARFDAAGRYLGYRGIGKDITERQRAQAAADEARRFARATLDALASLVCVLDASGTILTVNAAWRHAATKAGDVGAHCFESANYLAVCDAASGEARADGIAVAAAIRAVIAGTAERFRHEYGCETPSGKRWFALTISRFPGSGKERVVVGHEDITERRQTEAHLQRVNTLYQTLSETNDAIARITDRSALLREVAQLTIRTGQFLSAKIWMRDRGADTAHAEASTGDEGWDVGPMPPIIRLYGPEALGPTGVAFSEGRPDVCNDLSEDRVRPWRVRNALTGFRSCAAFPLREENAVVGVLSVYAAETGYFDSRLVELLARVAVSLSLAFDRIVHDAKRFAAEAALRESEARFRSLTELSSDWYWQQDDALRFTSACNGTEIAAGLASDADLGRTRWELDGVREADWEAHRAVLSARKPFRDFDMKRAFPDGTIRDIAISGAPIFDHAGRFTGYRGIGRDVTERKRAERILTLEHRIARCLAEPGDAADVLGAVIHAICETQGWACGVYFHADDEANVLRVSRCWGMPGGASEALFARSRDLVVQPGVGISGRVWQSGAPLWIHDIAGDDRPLRRDLILAAGARGAFAFPVVANGNVIGVLLFFSGDVREPDARLLAAVAAIGVQVGQFLHGRRAEDALRASEARYRALTELSSDWYWEHDEHQRFTRMSGGMLSSSEGIAASILNRTRWETVTGYDPRRRSALDAEIAARRPFREFEYRRVGADGVARDVQISGEPMFDAAGACIGYRGVGRDITERKATEDRLRFQALLLDTVGDAVIATGIDGTVTYWNQYAEQLYGWTAAEAAGRNVRDLTHGGRDGADRRAAMESVRTGAVWRGETQATHRDGTSFPAQLTLAAIRDGEGALTGLIGVSRDISELKRAEQAIRDNARQQGVIAAFGQHALESAGQAELLERAAAALVDGLAVEYATIAQVDHDGLALVARAGSGWSADEPDPRDAADDGPGSQARHALAAGSVVIVEDFARETRFAPAPMLAREGLRSGALAAIGGVGGPFGVLGAYARAPGRFGTGSGAFLQGIANILATVIDRRAAEEKIARLAQFDPLTGLPNRTLLHGRLAQTISETRRQDRCIGVMFLDLDGFKVVNDTFGHGVGDELLKLAAQRLRDGIREGDTVGRLGGDEFAVVLPNMASPGDASIVAQHIVAALARPFDLGGHEVRVTASIGISVFPGDGDDSVALLKNADTAMYRAKERGRNGWEFYTADLNSRAARRMEFEQELRQAVARDEFVLFYQPVHSLDTGRIVGAEALIRWQHPVRGLLPPGEFIALAEETGLIVPIGQWVVATACDQAAEWHRRGHSELFVAVNISPLEIRRGQVTEHVRAALAHSGLAPRHLEIELTETIDMGGAESFIRMLGALKEIGVTIAIDDFGTGYSTLGYLKRFPIDKVKIDRMFIRDVVGDVDDAAIVQAIIAMAHHLRLQVTAEGVETQAQAAFLRDCRCDSAQGFLFARPVPVAAFTALLDGAAGQPSWRLGPGREPADHVQRRQGSTEEIALGEVAAARAQ